MKLHLPALLATSAVALLSACGGGGGGSDSGYETLSSRADTTSALGGIAFQTRGGDGGVVRVSGNLKHDTGAVTISDGTYTLTDRNGANSQSVLTDGNAVVETGDPAPYEYVQAFNADYVSDGKTYNTAGFVGIETNAQDVPDAGRASYVGRAEAGIISASGNSLRTTQLTDGRSRVDANFGRGTVDVTLDGFDGANSTSVDTIEVRNMSISGSGFSGGELVTSVDGHPVDLVGSSGETTAEGAFFGYDRTISAPDEVAGLVVAIGDRYGVVGTYAAD